MTPLHPLLVASLLVGPLAPLGPRAAPSGILKRPVQRRVWLGEEGLDGDAQGDREHHGGREKALHHYPFEHYRAWRLELGAHEALARAGAFGENISTLGLTEADVAVGDVFRLGGALVQVSQGRQPCWRLNVRFGAANMALQVQQSGRTGWYYRVLEPGFVEAGDELALVDRLTPEWTIERLWRALYVDALNVGELTGMLTLKHLPENWRGYAARRLATRKVEDWTRRLLGEP